MKKCSACGKSNKEYEIFCKYCGNELNLFAGSCPRCKAPLEPLVKFCKKCGYDVSKPNNNFVNHQNKPDKKLIIAIATVGSVILITIIVLLILVYKPTDNTSAIPTTVIDVSASNTTNTIEENQGGNTGNINTTVFPEETTSISQETSMDYKYILGDYRGFNTREDGDKFLKRINIFENGDYIRIECYSEKNDAPELEDYPSGVVDIPKNEIAISNNRIPLDFYYEVDFRPKEDKIGYFDMKLKFYLDNTNILEGIISYNAAFTTGKKVSHTYTFELERY